MIQSDQNVSEGKKKTKQEGIVLQPTLYMSDMLVSRPALNALPSPPPPEPLLDPCPDPEESWPAMSLCSCIGTKTTLLFAPFAIDCSASSCRICMAAGDARMSAAWRMRRAASTSARAAMTFDSPIRFCCAADDSDVATSGEKMISLILWE